MVMSVSRTKYWVALALLVAPLFLSGCILERVLDNVVNKPPQAVIQASTREGNAPLDVRFDAQYSSDDGTIAEYRWSFGDPTSPQSEIGSLAVHTFTHPGTYIVKLSVIDDDGAVDSQQIAIVVTDAPPVAAASVSNDAPLPGVEVVFSAEASYDLHGDIVSYHWEFGDGTTGTGVTIRHTYIQGGYKVATLTVTDETGQMAQTYLGMNVQPGTSRCGDSGGSNAGGSCGGTDKPYAVITSTYFSCGAGGQVGDAITFDGSASRPGVGRIVTYHWDFGDGSTGSGAEVTHVYSKPYLYIVTLTVVDEAGQINKATGSISVGAASCS